ncbi:unnamed protein product [Protopolystoma xenopodis]|uniref:Uncharacterized protein n=1 Tax=Protopolystoma xenopodis TaxID=117903 RepID=A0A448WI43_9PLAT|nr:unnamed protein product [Protopolystoma xenopodis]
MLGVYHPSEQKDFATSDSPGLTFRPAYSALGRLNSRQMKGHLTAMDVLKEAGLLLAGSDAGALTLFY